MNTNNATTFHADAPVAIVMIECAGCGDDCCSHKATSIIKDEVFDLYVQDYSVKTREALFCPSCIALINEDYVPNDGEDDRYENRIERFGR